MITILKDVEFRIKANGLPELDKDLQEMIEILEKSMGEAPEGGVSGYRKKLEDIEREEKEKRDVELRKTPDLRKEDDDKLKDEAWRRKEQAVLDRMRESEPPVLTPEQEATIKEQQQEREWEYEKRTGHPMPVHVVAAPPVPAGHPPTVKELQAEQKERAHPTVQPVHKK